MEDQALRPQLAELRHLRVRHKRRQIDRQGLALVYVEPSNAPAAAPRALVMLALPAMLVGMMFATFVLLPLWHWVQRRETARTRPLLFSGSAAWLFLTAVFLALTTTRHGAT